MLKISPLIRNMHKMSYAKESKDVNCAVDCSAGSNPYGFSSMVEAAAKEVFRDLSSLNEYPHGLELKEAILDFWSPFVSLSLPEVLLCGGTIDGLYLINALFRQPEAVVLGINPQFPDYVAHAQLLGYQYKKVPLKQADHYRFDLESVLAALTQEVTVVYLDNPNNPTGQAIPLSAFRQILQKASALSCAVISDEAYGDYLPEGDSAARLLSEYDNLIVLRSFSKGFGLAGLRVGYLLSSAALCAHMDKISNPYMAAQPARLLACAALADRAFIQSCREAFTLDKQALRACTGENLHMAHTLDSCPITLLWHRDTGVDLASRFAQMGVMVYSGDDFEGIFQNSVRLRLPHREQMPLVLKAAHSINED